jgi:ADP-dependent glucokinase
MADGIAKRFKNSQVLLVGPIGPKLKELLSSNIEIPKPSLIEKDEVHLIMEYGKHEIFESWQSPVANRFIVSHDTYNSRMEFLDQFFATIREYKPDIIIISGLHLLESQKPEFR